MFIDHQANTYANAFASIGLDQLILDDPGPEDFEDFVGDLLAEIEDFEPERLIR